MFSAFHFFLLSTVGYSFAFYYLLSSFIYLPFPDFCVDILSKEAQYLALSATTDAKALELFAAGDRAGGIEYLTAFSNKIGTDLLNVILLISFIDVCVIFI